MARPWEIFESLSLGYPSVGNSYPKSGKTTVPPLCQEMHFRPIGRKKFFTQAEWAPSLPQASKRENSECPPKTLLLFGVHSLFSLLLA